MAIQVLSIAPNRDRETFDVTFAKYTEVIGRVPLVVNVPDHRDASANGEAAKANLREWIAELSVDLQGGSD